MPGWQLGGGLGPSLHFDDTEMSFSDVAGEAGGPLKAVLECAGQAQDIKVEVDVKGILGDTYQEFKAPCTPEGSRTTWTFDTGPNGYIVQHEAPAGTWTALTLLIPAASPSP